MHKLFHTKKLIVLGLVVAAVVALVTIVALRREKSGVYTVSAFQPPICTTNIPPSSCGDGVITVRSSNGELKEFRYSGFDSPQTEGFETNLLVLEPGMKVAITTAGLDQSVVAVRLVQ
jgi:hypothetical protein